MTALAVGLSEIVGAQHVRTALPERVTYARDGLPTHRRVPGGVVLPGSRDEVVAVGRVLAAAGRPLVARGAGTRPFGRARPGPRAGAVGVPPAQPNPPQ